ncbi:IS4 family transposase [Lusitaniella coriacea]|uniref:IS4 family transposase n=1 Tax=Lusitaniella coriacea TaxID=1983105 RepID=UPI003CF12655
MLEYYHKCLSALLPQRQYRTLQIIIILLQSYRTIQIEKLSAILPIPIKYESRRRHLQRFLKLPQLQGEYIWKCLVKKWIKTNPKPARKYYIALDRTRWQGRNLFVVSLIKDKRAIPLSWTLLLKKGSSSFEEQKRLLKPVLRLFKGNKIVILGDREFGHIALADWLSNQGVEYVLRTKDNKYVQQQGQKERLLSTLGLRPRKPLYLHQVKLTKQSGFGLVNIVGYWSKKTRKKNHDEGWYLITNLSSVKQAVSAYRHRFGIEAMFKDCKTGGYNLEKCQGSDERLLALVLLIAIAYTSAIKQGAKIKSLGVQQYVCRLKEPLRMTRRHSTFWVGLYGRLWVDADENCQELVEELMRLTPNKLPFYQQGQRAKRLILSSF